MLIDRPSGRERHTLDLLQVLHIIWRMYLFLPLFLTTIYSLYWMQQGFISIFNFSQSALYILFWKVGQRHCYCYCVILIKSSNCPLLSWILLHKLSKMSGEAERCRCALFWRCLWWIKMFSFHGGKWFIPGWHLLSQYLYLSAGDELRGNKEYGSPNMPISIPIHNSKDFECPVKHNFFYSWTKNVCNVHKH